MELNELPGSELILPGLEDLYHSRNNMIGSLLVSLAEPLWKRLASIRLTAAGLDIPQVSLVLEPELALYNYLQIDSLPETLRERDDAYPYYNGLLNSLNSFCAALELKALYRDTRES
jgi:hypothetical protein